MKKNKNYLYAEIENFANANDYAIYEWYLTQVIGENFIVLKSRKYDITYSFMLCGSQHDGFIYKCIYADL